MEKWKAKYAFHFPTPSTATRYLQKSMRYTNNPTGTKDRALQHVVGYRKEDRVDQESNTETFGAIRIEIDNWRWAGVPFYLRAGKRLEKRLTEVSIVFKQPPTDLFQNNSSG